MMFYPVFIQLEKRTVLVVGGGIVAERKVDGLLTAGADIVLVSPDVTEWLRSLAERRTIEIRNRGFQEADLDGATLVISATDDPVVQQQVAEAARLRKVMVNTVDRPEWCDFIIPAIVRRGDVVVAVSTSGKSPALAAALRSKIDETVGDDIGRAARLLGDIRGEIQRTFATSEKRKQAFEAILASGFLDWLPHCDDPSAMKRMQQIVKALE